MFSLTSDVDNLYLLFLLSSLARGLSVLIISKKYFRFFMDFLVSSVAPISALILLILDLIGFFFSF